MYVITANLTLAGHVVFLTSDNAWSTMIKDAALFQDEENLALALAKAADPAHEAEVVGVYEVEVSVVDGVAAPNKLRERIRVDGPSVAYGDDVKLEGFYAA